MPPYSPAALPAQASRAAQPSTDQLDRLLRDYQRQEYDFLTSSGRGVTWAEAGLGKGLIEGTPILTPAGWVAIESIRVGDSIIGSDGRGHRVKDTFDRGNLPVYEVTLSDGCQITCDGDHLWTTYYNPNRGSQTFDTRTIAERLKKPRPARHHLPLVNPVVFDSSSKLPVDPYVLGVLMGDGHLRKSPTVSLGPKDWVAEELQRLLPDLILTPHEDKRGGGNNRTWSITRRDLSVPKNPLTEALRYIGVWGQIKEYKKIPSFYLTASIEDRISLLQGLMDTDGSISYGTICDFTNKSEHLVLAVAELARSLGGTARITNRIVRDWVYWRVAFRLQLNPFRYPSKSDKHRPIKRQTRSIRTVKEIGYGHTYCIAVDSPDELFVTKDYILTHNTRTLALAARGRTLVIATAAIRDMRVWETEADTIGLEPFEVVSYHQTKTPGFVGQYAGRIDTLLLDEMHRLKERKVAWAAPINTLAAQTEFVYGGTGTPMPNASYELWAQLHTLYPSEFKHFWPWIEQWYGDTIPNRYNPDARDIPETLLGCRCRDPETCEHWDAFHDANIAGRAIRHLRDDVLTDLPPLSGHLTVLDTPMDPTQKRLYAGLKKELLASIPEEGIFLEALTDSHQFSMLHRLSFGLSSLDPSQDPDDKHSGKLPAIRQFLEDRAQPTVVTVWFRDTARAVQRLTQSMGLRAVMVGGQTPPKARAQAVLDFQAGNADVLVGSVGVIKEGVTLHRADEIILGERSWVPGDNEQVIRRLHRLGQTRPVTARQLVCPKSVDSYQWSVAGPIGTKATNIKRALRRSEIASLI